MLPQDFPTGGFGGLNRVKSVSSEVHSPYHHIYLSYLSFLKDKMAKEMAHDH